MKIANLKLKGVIFNAIKIGAKILAFLSLLFVLLQVGANARVGMFMLIAIPFVIWGALIYLKGTLGKNATQEGYEAFKQNIPKSDNPYLKPNAEKEDMEAAELWFTGYITAEKEVS